MSFSSTTKTLLVSLLSATALASPPFFPGHNQPGNGYGGASSGKSVYFQTNEHENALVAIPINPTDGHLSGGVKVSTGGSGGNIAVNGTSTPQKPDALGSQGSVTVAGNLVFVVNAGSGSLSLFETSPFGDTTPRLIGSPASLPGSFPNTVAVSFKNRLACVGFSGHEAGISCLPFSPRGLGKAGPLHPFDLGQATPPNSELDLLGQVFFSNDEKYLYTTVRGGTGFFASTPVSALLGHSSPADALSLRGSTVTLFDGVTIPGTDNVFASDPTLGARLLSVNEATQTASVEKTVNVTGQKATCWIALDEQTGSVYVDDAGQRRVVEIDSATGAITDELTYGGNAAGGFDLAVAGDYIYILFAGNGKVPGSITVITTKGKTGSLEYVQEFGLEALGITPNADGIAVLL